MMWLTSRQNRIVTSQFAVRSSFLECNFIHVSLQSCNECIQTPQLIQLMNIISNFVFHCNNCNANRVFIEFPESADQHG